MKSLILRTVTGLVLAILFLIFFIYLPPYFLSFLLFIILLLIFAFEWPRLLSPKELPFWLIAPLYPLLPFGMLIALNQNLEYRPLVLILVLLVAAHDTGSYFIGRFFGNHKIMTHISPLKTWEGFFGGYIFTLTALFIFLRILKLPVDLASSGLLAFVVSLLAFLGDLFESWLKRRASVKDSGTILPGHGGLLDRFDGILFVVVFFYLFKDYLVHFFNLP